jgi:hypothetical protein
LSDVGPKLEQARALFMSGRHEQARQLLERAMRGSPGQPELSNAMGLVLAGMGKLDPGDLSRGAGDEGPAAGCGVLEQLRQRAGAGGAERGGAEGI